MAVKKHKPSERSERNIAWIEAHCLVPEGKFVGQPIVLRDFQRNIMHGIYDGKTRRAIISFGRKNAKTALTAMLDLLHLVGPEAVANSQLFSAAQSRDQAAILFSLAAKMVRMNVDLSAYVTVRDTAKELFCPELGTKYKALSADASTAYGLSPVFAAHDELGQVRGPRSELYEALETASAAQAQPLSIVISTQAPNEDDLLSILIDDAKTNTDGRVKLFLYEADADSDPFEEETIRQANPAFGDFQNAEEVLAMAEDARRMPSREAEFRNLILNQRVEVNNPYVARGIWDANGGEPESLKDVPVYAGLDLSATADLTAFVMVGKVGEFTSVEPTFWLPHDGLAEKARGDRVPYDLWRDQGFLNTSPGKVVDYEFVASFLKNKFQEYDIRKLAFDRWNFRNFRPWLEKAGFTDDELERFVEFGQGFQSMSPALRDLDELLLNEKIRHGKHPVLSMCAANSVVKMDPAGNRKLVKLAQNRRIDGMIALTMAVTTMAEADDEPMTSPWDNEDFVIEVG